MMLLSIPEGAAAIKERAFAGSGLEMLFLPGSIQTIARNAFDGCGRMEVFAEEDAPVYASMQQICQQTLNDITLRKMCTVGQDSETAKWIDVNDRIVYSFTAETADTYSFFDMGFGGSNAVLMDAYGNSIASNDNGYNGSGFLINHAMLAGERVYLQVSLDNMSEDNTVRVAVKRGAERAAETIVFGNNKLVPQSGNMVRGMFTAPISGNYRFTAVGTTDINAAFRNTDAEITVSESNCERFVSEYYLKENESIYLDLESVSASAKPTFSAKVEYLSKGISIGTNTLSTNGDRPNAVAFTATNDGWYTFRSDESRPVYAKLYSNTATLIAEAEQYDANGNFIICSRMSGGETVYLEAGFVSESAVGSMKLVVEYDSGELKTGSNRLFAGAGETVERVFTAPGTDDFVFTAARGTIARMILRSASGTVLAKDDDAAIRYHARANETVRLEITAVQSASGMIDITITSAMTWLYVGETNITVESGESVELGFTAPSTGDYSFTFESDTDAFAQITQGGETQRIENEDGERDFLYSCNLAKGEELSIDLGFKSAVDHGTIVVTVDQVIPDLVIGEKELFADSGSNAKADFLARSAGRYLFSSFESGNTYGRLIDSDGTEIVSATGETPTEGFEFTADLDRYDMVRLETGFVSNEVSGPLRIRVERILCLADNEVYLDAAEKLRTVFIAPRTGNYTFQSTGSGDTSADLYDNNGNRIASGDDEEGKNFKITRHIEAGTKVVLVVKFFNPHDSGYFNVNVS